MTEILSADVSHGSVAHVKVEITHGIGIQVVGLTDLATKECLLRTVTALQTMGYHIPGKKIVITITPAANSHSTMYDLPLALALIMETDGKGERETPRYLIAGECGLDGSVRKLSPGHGAKIAAIAQANNMSCILPVQSAIEAAGYVDIDVMAIDNIYQALQAMSHSERYLVWNSREFLSLSVRTTVD